MGIPQQVALDLPVEIAAKIATGRYAITDVVVRNLANGRYDRFLPVDKLSRVVQKSASTLKLPDVLKNLGRFSATPAGWLTGIGAGAVVGTVIGVTRTQRQKWVAKDKQQEAVIERLNNAIVNYLKAANAAQLGTDTIDELVAALDHTKAVPVTGKSIDIKVLADLVSGYTAKLAEANYVEVEPVDDDAGLAPVIRIKAYLATQRKIFDQAV